jgi:hypothetical protein
MNRHLLRVLLALYPRDWRDRYGAEVAGLGDELIAAGETTPLHGALDMLAGAAAVRGRALAVRWRALAGSLRLPLATAVAVIAAVAGSMFGAANGHPAPVPAGLDSVRCVLPREAGAVMVLPPAAGPGQVSRALIRVRIAARPGTRCLVIPALCRVTSAKPRLPGRVEPGQCVVASPGWCRIASARVSGHGRPVVRACPELRLSS